MPDGGTLLVPVANPETTDRLVDTAFDVSRERSMRTIVLHVVEVPAQLPLSEGGRLLSADGHERRLLQYASDRGEDEDIDIETRIRYARDVATGIVGAIDEYGADALLMGWRGRPRRRDVVLGSFLDRVLGEAQCDVFVKRIRLPTDGIDSILVPVAGGPHDELATELAGTIAAQHDAEVHLIHVARREDADPDDDGTTVLTDRRAILGDGIQVTTRTIESDHVAGAITDETEHHDLTIVGATREPFLKRKLVGSVAQGVGRSAANSVIVTRRGPTADGE